MCFVDDSTQRSVRFDIRGAWRGMAINKIMIRLATVIVQSILFMVCSSDLSRKTNCIWSWQGIDDQHWPHGDNVTKSCSCSSNVWPCRTAQHHSASRMGFEIFTEQPGRTRPEIMTGQSCRPQSIVRLAPVTNNNKLMVWIILANCTATKNTTRTEGFLQAFTKWRI